MSGKEQTKAPLIRLRMHFRRMRQEQLARRFRHPLQSAVKIMRLVEIRIINPHQMNPFTIPLQRNVFIQKETNPSNLQRRQLIQKIMIVPSLDRWIDHQMAFCEVIGITPSGPPVYVHLGQLHHHGRS